MRVFFIEHRGLMMKRSYALILSVSISWLLIIPASVYAEAPTDEELKTLEQQIEQQEAEQAAAKRRATEEIKRKAEEETKRKAEAERLRTGEETKRQLEEENRRKVEDEQRLAAEEERHKEEERKLADEQRKHEQGALLAEQEKRRLLEESRMERQKRSAKTQDSFGYVDDLVAQDVMQLEQKQKLINISAKIDKWQNSGVLIKKGNTYKITATGQWSMGGLCNPTGPDGEGIYGIACWDLGNQTVAGYTHSALIGKIGTQKPAFFTGREYQFTSDEEGVLYFMANDALGFFFDNTGSFSVTIGVE